MIKASPEIKIKNKGVWEMAIEFDIYLEGSEEIEREWGDTNKKVPSYRSCIKIRNKSDVSELKKQATTLDVLFKKLLGKRYDASDSKLIFDAYINGHERQDACWKYHNLLRNTRGISKHVS